MAIRTPFAPHHLIMFPWGGVTTPRRPTIAALPTAGHTGPALQAFYQLRTPCQNPVIANRCAHRCGNPYSPRTVLCRKGNTDSHVAALLGMTVTRKSSCPPWGGVTTPRRPITHGTSCDVSVRGGVPDAPPTTHRTPAKTLSLRGAQRRGNPHSPCAAPHRFHLPIFARSPQKYSHFSP